MRNKLNRTIMYYALAPVDPLYDGPSLDKLVATAYDSAPMIRDRLLEGGGLRRSCFINQLSQERLGLRILMLLYDDGYRPKKIEQNLNRRNLKPEDIALGENEEVADIVHILVCGPHLLLESRNFIRYSSVSRYLSWLIQRHIDPDFVGITLSPAAKRDPYEEMRLHGVKEITLDLSPWHGPADDNGNNTYYTVSRMAHRLQGRRGRVVLTPRRGRHLALNEAIGVFQEAEDYEGGIAVAFKLGNGSLLNSSDFKLRKPVAVENDGTKNAQTLDMFSQMEGTYLEWVKNDYLKDHRMAPPG